MNRIVGFVWAWLFLIMAFIVGAAHRIWRHIESFYDACMIATLEQVARHEGRPTEDIADWYYQEFRRTRE